VKYEFTNIDAEKAGKTCFLAIISLSSQAEIIKSFRL